MWKWILQAPAHLQDVEVDKFLKGVRLDSLQSVVIDIPVTNSVWSEQWAKRYPGIPSDLIQTWNDLSHFSLINITPSWNKVELMSNCF